MADAVQYDIMLAIQTGLRALTFASQETTAVRPIATASIVWKKVTTPNQLGNLVTPGWLITPGKRIEMQRTAGENQRDDVWYSFLCQLVDGDQEDPQRGLRSYMKWLEQACKYFRNQDIGISSISSNEGGVTWNCEASMVFTVDTSRWERAEFFVGGVELRFGAYEPRGAS